MRQGNYGNSLSSVQMIAEAFNAFVKAADSVEGRVKEFMTTADRLMKDPQLDSRRIRHEVDETERRWKTFYNSIKNYGAALADSAKFFENWQAVSVTIRRPLIMSSKAVVTTIIRLRFHCRSTPIRLQFDRATTIRRPTSRLGC